jgi:hypothetical protein
VERFNEAVGRFNDGEHDEATALLETLLAEPVEHDIRRNAEELLRSMRRATEGVLGSREVWFSLFPVQEAVTGVSWDRCSEIIDDFLGDAAGESLDRVEATKEQVRDIAACHPQTPFHVGGAVVHDTALMRVGPGVYPYIAVTQSRQLDLHIAVVVPARAGDEISDLELLADDRAVATIPTSAAITHQVLQMSQGGGYIAIDLAKETLAPETLKQLIGAKKPAVEFGPASRQRIKISRRNAATIEEVLATYAAMQELVKR